VPPDWQFLIDIIPAQLAASGWHEYLELIAIPFFFVPHCGRRVWTVWREAGAPRDHN